MNMRRQYILELTDAELLRLRLMVELLRWMPRRPPVPFDARLVLRLALTLGFDALAKELEQVTGWPIQADRADPAGSSPFPGV